MNALSVKYLLSAVCLPLILAGCASTPDPEIADGLKESEARFFSKAGGQGCILGGLGAGGVCLLVAPNQHVLCVMAAIGGCAAGMGANYLLDKIRAKYATTERRLGALRDFMEADYKAGIQMVNTMKQLLAEDKAELAKLEQTLTDKSVIQDKIYEQSERMDKNIEYMNNILEEARERLNQVKVARNSLALRPGLSADSMMKVSDIDFAYQRQKELFAELEQAITEYNKARYML